MKRAVVGILTALLCFLIGVGASQLWTTWPSEVQVTEVANENERTLVFEGTLLKIAPPVPASGTVAWYRLAKYRVERVVYGHYPYTEIVVDHMSFTGEELDGIQVGDRVCVALEKSKKIHTRTYVSGFREEGETINIFYISGDVDPHSSACR